MKIQRFVFVLLALLGLHCSSSFAADCTASVAADGKTFLANTLITGTAAATQFNFGSTHYPDHVSVSSDQFQRFVVTEVEFDLLPVQEFDQDEEAYLVQKRRYCSMLNSKDLQCQDECVRWSAATVDHRT